MNFRISARVHDRGYDLIKVNVQKFKHAGFWQVVGERSEVTHITKHQCGVEALKLRPPDVSGENALTSKRSDVSVEKVRLPSAHRSNFTGGPQSRYDATDSRKLIGCESGRALCPERRTANVLERAHQRH
jgi:hypothetical protein